MSFIVAGCVLLLALLVGAVFDDEGEPGEDDPVSPYSFITAPPRIRRVRRVEAEDVVRVWPIDKRAGNVKNDGRELLEPHASSEASTLLCRQRTASAERSVFWRRSGGNAGFRFCLVGPPISSAQFASPRRAGSQAGQKRRRVLARVLRRTTRWIMRRAMRPATYRAETAPWPSSHVAGAVNHEMSSTILPQAVRGCA